MKAYTLDTDLVTWYPHVIGTGTTIYDYSSSSNNGAAINIPTWRKIPYQGSYGLDFNGTTQYVNFQNNILRTETEYSVSAWIYLTDMSGTNHIFSWGKSTDSNIYISFWVPSTGDIKGAARDGVNQWIYGTNSTGLITVNNWHHVVWTHTGIIHKAYVDGVEKEITFSVTTNKNFDFNSATWNTATQWGAYATYRRFGIIANYLNGKMSDVMIFKRILLPEEIKDIYKSTYRR